MVGPICGPCVSHQTPKRRESGKLVSQVVGETP